MPRAKQIVTAHEAKRADIPKFIDPGKAAFPILVQEHSVGSGRHPLSPQRVWPQSQHLAEAMGRTLGTASTMRVDPGPDPLRHHPWAGVTDSGSFPSHPDPADSPAHPEARGRDADAALRKTNPNQNPVPWRERDLDGQPESRPGGTVTPRPHRIGDLLRLITLLPGKKSPSRPGDGPLGGQPGSQHVD